MFRISTILGLALVILCAPAVAEKREMSPEEIIALRRVSDPQLSPNGQDAAFVVTTAELAENNSNSEIWRVSTVGGEPVRLTRHPKKDEKPRWSPDGRLLAFISDRSGKSQIYLIDPFGGEPEKLTDHKEEIDSFEWLPDGKGVLFIAKEPRSEEEEKKRKQGYDQIVVDGDLTFSHIYKIDLESRKAEQLTRGRLHVVQLAPSPSGERVAFLARPTPKLADIMKTEVYLMSVSGGEPERLTSNRYAEQDLNWSPDGTLLSWLANTGRFPGFGPERIHILTPVSKAGEPKVLSANFDGYIQQHRWDRSGKQIYFYADVGVNRHIYRIGLDVGLEQLSRGEGLWGPFAVSAGGMLIIRQDPKSPPDLWFAQLESGPAIERQARRLTRMNPEADDFLYGEVETVRWKAPDGLEIEGLLIYPVGYQPGLRYPLVVSVHGGPQGAYQKSFMASHGEFPHLLAARGFACFFPNFRGSSNYGQDFAEANIGDLGGGDYRDIMSGVDYLIERGIADPERLAVKGWSYGGYMSGWIITHTDRFKAAVFGAGVSNVFSYYSQADIQYSRETLHQGTPWSNRQQFLERSPVFYVDKAKTPSLIFHGEKDERVPLPQSKELYMGLKLHNVPVELVIYPREPHGLREPAHQLDKIKRELEWLERYLKRS